MDEVVHIIDRTQSGNFLRLDHPLVVRAFEVVAGLTTWISETEGLATYPVPSISVSGWDLVVAVGEIHLWDSQVHEDEELTFEHCRNELLAEISDLAKLLPPSQ